MKLLPQAVTHSPVLPPHHAGTQGILLSARVGAANTIPVGSILVQQNDSNNDPVEGPNGPVFLADIDAVAQIIYTTLRLLLGEWWENLTIGFPLFQSLIGTSGSPTNQQGVILIIQQTILGCPYVQQILDFSFIFNTATLASTFRASVQTSFGTIIVTNAPGSSAQVTN